MDENQDFITMEELNKIDNQAFVQNQFIYQWKKSPVKGEQHYVVLRREYTEKSLELKQKLNRLFSKRERRYKKLEDLDRNDKEFIRLKKEIDTLTDEEKSLEVSFKENIKNDDSPIVVEEGIHLKCGHCKEYGKAIELLTKDKNQTKPFSNKSTVYYLENIKCPNCGTIVNYKEAKHISFKNENRERVSEKVFINGDMIKLKWIDMVYTAYNNSIQTIPVHQFITINPLTGHSYMFEARTQNGKKFNSSETKIRTVTLVDIESLVRFEPETIQELYDVIYSKVSDRLGYSPKKQNLDRLRHVILFNRYPNIDIKSLENFLDMFNFYQKNKKLLYKIKPNEDNPIDLILSHFKIKSRKSYRKTLAEDINYIYTIEFLEKNLKDVNNIDSLLKYSCEMNNPDLLCFKNHSLEEKIVAFLKLLIDKFGESTFVKKISTLKTLSKYYLSDTAYMYYELKEKAPTINIDLTGNMIDIHDRLSEALNKIKNQLCVFEYNKEELNLEQEMYDYKFVLAKDNHELLNIGNKLRICVGGYASGAFKKELYIVNLFKDGEIINCIEIDKHLSAIKQTKCFANKTPKDELLNVITEWAIMKGIRAETYDLEGDVIEHINSSIKEIHYNIA